MVQSTKVNIDETGTFERTRPLALEPHIPQYQWESFANNVDRIVLKHKEDSKKYQVVLAVGPLLGMGLFATGGFLSVQGGGFNPLIFFGVLVFIGCPILGMTLMFRLSNAWKEEMKAVAEDTSKKIQNLTIHFNEEKIPYIRTSSGRSGYSTKFFYEFSYKDDVEATAAVVVAEPEIILYPSAPYVDPLIKGHTTDIKSAKERLDELEKVKDLISQAEYGEKRKEILSSI